MKRLAEWLVVIAIFTAIGTGSVLLAQNADKSAKQAIAAAISPADTPGTPEQKIKAVGHALKITQDKVKVLEKRLDKLEKEVRDWPEQ